MDLDQFEGHTPGPWVKADRMNGPWWGISSQYSVNGNRLENGRQSVTAVHGAHRGSGYAEMFAANARLIAAAPDLLAEVRRLTADYSGLLEKHNALHLHARACRDERDRAARLFGELSCEYEAMQAERDELAARLTVIRNALQSLLSYAEQMNEAVAHECGVRFVDDGPLMIARTVLSEDAGSGA